MLLIFIWSFLFPKFYSNKEKWEAYTKVFSGEMFGNQEIIEFSSKKYIYAQLVLQEDF